MLPTYIIEELKRRERVRGEETQRPQPQLEVDLPQGPSPLRDGPRREEAEAERGIAIIQVG